MVCTVKVNKIRGNPIDNPAKKESPPTTHISERIECGLFIEWLVARHRTKWCQVFHVVSVEAGTGCISLYFEMTMHRFT